MELLTIKKASELLGISRTSLYGLIRAGLIRTVRVSKRTVRITRRELERFVAEREAASAEA
ncbi:MAG: helix-turn-helix domain-containing protein [Fimbriimonadaceae bacterium]|jgi:excisionase family DNA binding protein